MLIELNDDMEYKEENGFNGFYIVQIKEKIRKNTFKACILTKILDKTYNSYSLQETNEIITVSTKQFVLPEEYVNILETKDNITEIVKDNISFIPMNNIKNEMLLKKPKIENYNIFENYCFIVTVGGEDSANQMKKNSNIEDQNNVKVNKIEIQEKIKKMGGTIHNVNSLNASKLKNKFLSSKSFVIASIPSRTEKFLLGLALKLPIVSYNWINECYNAEKFLNYNEFLLSHGYSKEVNSYIGSFYSPNKLFNNLKFFLVGNSNFKATYKLLISYSGGEVIKGQIDKNLNQCHYVICSKTSFKADKPVINKIIQIIQEYQGYNGGYNLSHNLTRKRSISNISRSSSFMGMIEQTEEEMDITEDEVLKDIYMTTENEDEIQSSYKNGLDTSSIIFSSFNNHPVILQDEWIIQCLINQRIVNYNKFIYTIKLFDNY